MASRNESPFFFFGGSSLSSPAETARSSVDDVDDVSMLLHLDGWNVIMVVDAG